MFGDAANIPSFTSGHHLLESSVHAPLPWVQASAPEPMIRAP